MTRTLLALLLSVLPLLALPVRGEEPKPADAKTVAERNVQKVPTKIEGTFEGGELVALPLGDRLTYLIKPTGKVDPQRRWILDFPYWMGINDGFGHIGHRYYVEKFLAAGFHVAGVDVRASFGSPAASEVCQQFYQLLVAQHGLNKRARILAHSHGGLFAYGYAMRHPTCVERIGGMCPAIDFRSYPGLSNAFANPIKGSDYDLSFEEFERRAAEFNPIDNLEPLAKAGVKILHLHGDADTLVSTAANATELERRYRALGGDARVVLLPLPAERRGHDGPELYESATLLEFLVGD